MPAFSTRTLCCLPNATITRGGRECGRSPRRARRTPPGSWGCWKALYLFVGTRRKPTTLHRLTSSAGSSGRRSLTWTSAKPGGWVEAADLKKRGGDRVRPAQEGHPSGGADSARRGPRRFTASRKVFNFVAFHSVRFCPSNAHHNPRWARVRTKSAPSPTPTAGLMVLLAGS